MPEVSVIMPAYNAANFIAGSIMSVIQQTFSDWELIIIDDGSSDQTREIVDEFVKKDKRVKYIYQSNGRQGKARNNGIKNCTGKVIAFLDADDLWLPNKIELQLASMKSSSADLVYSDYFIFTNEFDLTCSQIVGTEATEYLGIEGTKKFLERNRIPILTVLCKKDAILNVGGFAEEYRIQNAEDYHLWLKLQLAGYKFIGLEEPLAAYREHNQSVSSADRTNIRQIIEAQFDLYNKYEDKKNFFRPYLIRMIKFSLFSSSAYKDDLFYESIKRYLVICKMGILVPVFNIFQKLGLRSLTLKSAYFAFNYLTPKE